MACTGELPVLSARLTKSAEQVTRLALRKKGRRQRNAGLTAQRREADSDRFLLCAVALFRITLLYRVEREIHRSRTIAMTMARIMVAPQIAAVRYGLKPSRLNPVEIT